VPGTPVPEIAISKIPMDPLPVVRTEGVAEIDKTAVGCVHDEASPS
jgi:hypothetical protein